MAYRDHPNNILGVDTSNNLFTSSNVVADANGSMIERLEFIQNGVSRISTKALVAADLTGAASTVFTVAGGPIAILHLGVWVTTAIPAGANTLKFQFDIDGAGATADLCAATDTASAAINQLFVVDGVKATALVKVTDPGIMVAANETAMPIVVSIGTITKVFSAGPPATGAITIFMEWQPLHAASTVTVA